MKTHIYTVWSECGIFRCVCKIAKSNY